MAKQQNKILILIGLSGAGKDAVAEALRENHEFYSITPHATRAKREGESEGSPYYFISEKRFFDMIADEEFVEYASYLTEFNGVAETAYYGTALASIPSSKDSVVTIGILAGVELKKRLGDRAKLIHLHVHNSVREERARQRGSFDQIEWDSRLARDHKLFANGLPDGVDISIDNMQPLRDTVKDILDAL